ncbi:hypothetical protein AcW1_006068 [Taiwanofungus camphoratus]|nr:hypothetical protein AcW2_004831 [Antrodia cinnamomea]KAI0934603.1 hypothetical protein AcV5_006390 [Antrodia cinnamomea]KAI0950114.1 hypothetical protein AcV7_008679 [Antrodia cinnamomea]KAI0957790.1 hypothetical protein AcW1_006068 [Antrodia cinnamomea]
MAPIRSKQSKQSKARLVHATDSGKGSSTRIASKLDASVASSSKVQLSSTDYPEERLPQGKGAHTAPKPYDRPTGRPDPLRLSDLECIRRLGSGGFGQVLVVRVRDSDERSAHPMWRPGSQLAMKVIYKKNVREDEQDNPWMRDVRSDERRYLVQLPWNPFITGLIDTFVDQRNFYYLLELAPCTSFAHYLSKRGRISTADARFYFSNIVLAIEFLHTHDVVHRDVKPGNLMLGGDGYISLGDFGCATHQSDDRDWEGFGTREYLAPELHEGNTVYPQGRKFVDWWSAAVTLFEMVTSKLPFPGRSEIEILAHIASQKIQWPSNVEVDADLKDLVTKMLVVEPMDRFGIIEMADKDGLSRNDEIRLHPFMRRHIKWKKIAERREVAPYVPVPYPDLTEGWYDKGVPRKRQIPELARVPVPVHRAWDDRRGGGQKRRK